MLILIFFWFFFGLLGASIAYAHLQREFPSLANEERVHDTIICLLSSTLGPFNLIIVLVVFGAKYGVLFPGMKP